MAAPSEHLTDIERRLAEHIAESERHLAEVEALVQNPELIGTTELEVALVGCGKLKAKEQGLAAKDLYTGVPFRLAYSHAKATADDVHILSALHGLVNPFAMLAPYDFSMVQMPPSMHIEWGRRVLGDLKAAYPMRRLKIVFYAGTQYIRPIMRAVTDEARYWTFHDPLKGLDLFERIRWFKANDPLPF
jgi:hypothetical protein